MEELKRENKEIDFEDYLLMKGYSEEKINKLLDSMLKLKPLSEKQMKEMNENFKEYLVVGTTKDVASKFLKNKNYREIFEIQNKIKRDIENSIIKNNKKSDYQKIFKIYNNIYEFLMNENKKFQITKIESSARTREYIKGIKYLESIGVIKISYCLKELKAPLNENYNSNDYKIYFSDTWILVNFLRENLNEKLSMDFNAYNGAIYENVIAEMLAKQGFELYFYKNKKSTTEMNFFIENNNYLIPIETKNIVRPTISLRNLLDNSKYRNIKYGIKLCNTNISFNGLYYTFPYFLTFLLKRYLDEKNKKIGAPEGI